MIGSGRVVRHYGCGALPALWKSRAMGGGYNQSIYAALYLTHWLVLLAGAIVKPIYPGGFLYGFTVALPPKVLVALDFTILITACLITAHIFYICVARPSLKFFKNRLPTYCADVAQKT